MIPHIIHPWGSLRGLAVRGRCVTVLVEPGWLFAPFAAGDGGPARHATRWSKTRGEGHFFGLGLTLQVSTGGLQSGAKFTEAAVPRPASKEGKLELTKALRSHDRSRGNSRKLPLWSAVDEVPREVRERRAADHLVLLVELIGEGTGRVKRPRA